MRAPVLVLALATIASSTGLAGCFGDSSSPPPSQTPPGLDAGPSVDSSAAAAPEAGADATVADSGGPNESGPAPTEAAAPGDAGAAPDGSDASEGGTCPVSTCSSVEVVFQGWIPTADGGVQTVPIAVDKGSPDGGVNGTVVLALDAGDPNVGHENVLVGDFVTTADGGVAIPVQYANDNNACDVPNFGGRTNAYYLAPMRGLPVDPAFYQPACACGGNCGGPCNDSGTGGACDFENGFYSQSCPNFGFNCVPTPEKIEAIEVLPSNGDPTCRVCLYGSTAPSTATLIKCIAPNVTLSGAQIAAAVDGSAAYPVLLRLDDGSNCAAY